MPEKGLSRRYGQRQKAATRKQRLDIVSIETERCAYFALNGQTFWETEKSFQVRDLHGMVMNIEKRLVLPEGVKTK